MDNNHYCIYCSNIVTARMHAITCDGCERWQHRKCNTGVTPDQYKQLKRGEITLEWKCRGCSVLFIPNSPPSSPIRQLTDYSVRSDDIEDVSMRIEDRTFDVENRDIECPQNPMDESIQDLPLDETVPEDVPISYEIVEKGSKRGGRKLVSSDGYTYTARNVSGSRTYWTCSVRGKKLHCYASVKQFGDSFTRCLNSHLHAPEPGILKKIKISTKVKQVARENVFRPCGDIVECVMRDMVDGNDVNLPKPELLQRAANLHRQKLRPKEPTNLDFEIDTSFIGEDFLMQDLRVDDHRHIISATPNQLHHLKEARRWFIDGTFKIVRRPFYQLLTIHSFVKKGEDLKQVPLVYVLMSRRTTVDYIEVFNCIKNRLLNPLVEWFMVDFEAAAWQAIRDTFPGCVVMGCVFHWNQSVYRKVWLPPTTLGVISFSFSGN